MFGSISCGGSEIPFPDDSWKVTCHVGGGVCWWYNQVEQMMMSSVSGGEMNVFWYG